MPSPIAHTAVALSLAEIGKGCLRPRASRPLFVLSLVFLSLAPDVDAIALVLGEDLGRWHNQFTHSLLFALGMTVAGLGVLRVVGVVGWRSALALSAAAVVSHFLMDWASAGRGLMLLWPFSEVRYRSPLLLFEGLHWSEGWFSPRHVLTLANELAFTGVLVLLLAFRRRGHRHSHDSLSEEGVIE
jgi:inner membrane protein